MANHCGEIVLLCTIAPPQKEERKGKRKEQGGSRENELPTHRKQKRGVNEDSALKPKGGQRRPPLKWLTQSP